MGVSDLVDVLAGDAGVEAAADEGVVVDLEAAVLHALDLFLAGVLIVLVVGQALLDGAGLGLTQMAGAATHKAKEIMRGTFKLDIDEPN